MKSGAVDNILCGLIIVAATVLVALGKMPVERFFEAVGFVGVWQGNLYRRAPEGPAPSPFVGPSSAAAPIFLALVVLAGACDSRGFVLGSPAPPVVLVQPNGGNGQARPTSEIPPEALATSITPITSLSDAVAGFVYSGESWEVTCTITGGSATLYPVWSQSGGAWYPYQDYSYTLNSSVGARGALILPAKQGSSLTWNLYKASGAGTVSSCQANGRSGSIPPGPTSASGGGGGGTVTSIAQGTGMVLTPNPIVTTGTVALATTGVVAGSYTSLNATIDAYGRITAASSGTTAPQTILETALWINANAAPQQNTSATGALLDISGKGYRFSASGSGLTYQATGGPNGLPAWNFDGTVYTEGSPYTLILPGGSPAVSVFAVIYLTSFTGVPEIIQIGTDHATPLNAFQFAIYSDGGIYCSAYGGEGNERYTDAGTISTSTWTLVEWIITPGAFSASNPVFKKNGIAVASTRGAGTDTPNIQISTARIGANLQGTPGQKLPSGSRIAELIVLNSIDSTSIARIESYLISKYAL